MELIILTMFPELNRLWKQVTKCIYQLTKWLLLILSLFLIIGNTEEIIIIVIPMIHWTPTTSQELFNLLGILMRKVLLLLFLYRWGNSSTEKWNNCRGLHNQQLKVISNILRKLFSREPSSLQKKFVLFFNKQKIILYSQLLLRGIMPFLNLSKLS